MDSPEPIYFDLDEDENVGDWIFDEKPLIDTEFINGPTYKKAFLTLNMIQDLYRLSSQSLGFEIDKNNFYLFNYEFFMNAKALNLAIPGGPKFEPLFRDILKDYDDDWNEFNDLEKIII